MDSLQAILDQIQVLATSAGGVPAYGLIFLLLVACGFGVPLSEDLLLIGAAILTVQDALNPYVLSVVVILGVITGDLFLFHWGRVFGLRILNSKKIQRLISPAKIVEAQAVVQKHGAKWLFATRFLPGLRTSSYFVAGSMKLPYRAVILYDGAAACIEVPLVIFGVRYLGGNMDEIKVLLGRFQYVVLALVVTLVLFLVIRSRLARRRK